MTPILRDLGSGLILRRATSEDIEHVASFNSKIHSDLGPDNPATRVGVWTSDLMDGRNPTTKAADFTVVEDTASGQIVSTLCLISQTWRYGGQNGIAFGVGRPELVGTLAEYRNRGLVRAQFDVVHQWSAERGEPLQAITGIPYYYRIFGYEMALELQGGRAGYLPQVPKLKDGETEPYQIRPALETDLPFIARLYEQGQRRSLVSCVRDEALWRYELNGASPLNVNRRELRIIQRADGEAVGFLAHPTFAWGQMMATDFYELLPGVSWGAVTPSVIRYLVATGEVYEPEMGKKEPLQAFGFWLGTDHPVYSVIPDRLPRSRRSYAYYIRIPDLPAFLRKIAPVLEQRLAASNIAGYTGEVKITFYRSGVHLGFTQGKLTTCEDYRPTPVGHAGSAAFPPLTFLQMLFGFRSLDDLKYAFVDCWTDSEQTHVLLNTLFPKQSSLVWPFS